MTLKRKEEFRAIPVNEERRNALIEEMNKLCVKAEEETRSLNAEEAKKFKELEEEVRLLDETIAAEEKLKDLNREKRSKDPVEKEEEKRFMNFLRTGETRDLKIADNKAVIPTTISSKIIEKIEELAVIFPKCTKFYAKGELTFAVDNNNLGISAAYVEDMAKLTEKSTKPETVTLKNNIIGSLAVISRSLLNNTDLDLLPYVIYKIAKALTDFIEKELVSGTTKMSGIVTSKNVVTTAEGANITADELIALQLAIPTTVKNATWAMNRDTLLAVRKLKSNDGEYLCGKMADGFTFQILGRPVEVSENMPDIGINNVSVAYGDFSGMYLKFSQDIEIQTLIEQYAIQHSIGVLGYVECDSKIVEESKIAILKGAES